MIKNYLTIDVEDYYQVSAFENIIKPTEWDAMEHRVANNTKKILALLTENKIKATFFIVGWVADKYPYLVKDIHAHGHAIGCHSYWHRKVYDLTPEEFRADTKRAKSALEDIIGQPVLGYRAPSYSITNNSLWAIDILKDLGFTYDSSIFPIHHDTYGIPQAPRFAYRHPNGLMEYPISTALFLRQKIPISGGGYFRLLPYWITKLVLAKINQTEHQPFIFYFHPWEIDPKQPRMSKASWRSRFRHYQNLEQTEQRLVRLLKDFSFGALPTC